MKLPIFTKCSPRTKNLGTCVSNSIYSFFTYSAFGIQFFSSQSLNTFSNLNIQWFALNENGFIKDSDEFLQNKAAVYIYQSLFDQDKIYVGSSANVSQR